MLFSFFWCLDKLIRLADTSKECGQHVQNLFLSLPLEYMLPPHPLENVRLYVGVQDASFFGIFRNKQNKQRTQQHCHEPSLKQRHFTTAENRSS